MGQGLEVAVQPVLPRRRRRPGRRAFAGLLVLAVGALAVVASGGLRGDALHATPARPSRIAVVDASGGLSTVAIDGSDRRDYPLPGLTAQFPAWSPDGRSVAAIAMSSDKGELVVVDDRATDGPAAPTVVYHADPSLIYLSWAPGGRRIGLLTGEADSLSLRLVAADGGAEPSVVTRGQPLYWDWIDDTRVLVHSGGDAADAFVGEVAVDGSARTPVATSAGPFQSPAVSADGRYRAYEAGGPVGAPSVIVEGRSGRPHHEAAVEGPTAVAWNPRLDELAYTAPSGLDLGLGPLRVLDAASGDSRELLAGLVVAYAWAPDGRTVAAIRAVLPGPSNSAFRSAEPAAARFAMVASFPAGGPRSTSESPDVRGAASEPAAAAGASGLVLDFVDTTSGAIRSETSIRLPDVLVSQFLPFFDQYSRSHHVWSPAGDAVVLPLIDASGVSQVTIIPADGSAPRRIAEGVEAFWGP